MKYILAGLLALFGVNSYAVPNINILTAYSYNAWVAVHGDAGMVTVTNQQIANIRYVLSMSWMGDKVTVTNLGSIRLDDPALEGPPTPSLLSKLSVNPQMVQTRFNVQADLVILIGTVPGTADGIATVPNWGGPPVSNVIYSFGMVTLGALPNYTYVHEWGHLMGARHQAVGGSEPDSGNPIYAHPFMDSTHFGTGCVYTLMGSNMAMNTGCTNAERIPAFSNTYGRYQPYNINIGDNVHNNGLTIVQTAPTVSQYRQYLYSGGAGGGGTSPAKKALIPITQIILFGT